MSVSRRAVDHPVVVTSAVVALLVIGVWQFLTTSRREDPAITIRDCLVLTSWPGAGASRVETLVTDPIEKALDGIPEIATIRSKSLVGLSILQVTIDDATRDTEQVFDDVRAKVEPVAATLPAGCGAPRVDSDFGDVFEVCLALHQVPARSEGNAVRYTPRELERFAERVENELRLLRSVGRVELFGAQPERIYVEVDGADWARIDLTASELRGLFEARNIVEPGGELDTATIRYAVAPTGEFDAIEPLRDLVVDRRDGAPPVRLGDLPVRIERRYEEPPRTRTRFTRPGAPSLASLVIGVSMKAGRNVAEMSAEIDGALERVGGHELPDDIRLVRVNDLPRQVEARIGGFRNSLIGGVAIVLLVVLLVMGPRPSVLMAAAVPLSMISALAVVLPFGVELEQFAIASLIIALGMVVDNAIVVSDHIVRLVRDGAPVRRAAVRAAHELAVPILTSTLTTIAAFLPMLTIRGNVGEYVRSLPIVVAATLLASLLIALVVTPLLATKLLRPRPGANPTDNPGPSLYERVVAPLLARPYRTLAAAGVLLGASASLLPHIGTEFFPSGLRDQFFVKVWLPAGAPFERTSETVRAVERALVRTSARGDKERLAHAASFVGTGGPRLMLTQEPEYDHPYYGFVICNTTDPAVTDEYARDVEAAVREIPGARITVERFVLGPPVRDPVAFRISCSDPDLLRRRIPDLVREVKRTPGARDVDTDWGAAGHQLEVRIDSDRAALAGVTNADVALTLRSLLDGAPLTTFREGDHRVPIALRTLREQRKDLADLAGLFVNGRDGKVPLDSVAEVVPTWEPAAVARRDGVPTVTIGCRPAVGMLANTLARDIRPRLRQMIAEMPPGVSLETGGEPEETAKAQAQVFRAVLLAVLLIVFVLVVQYDSFAKALVVLGAVPLALIGVFVGLAATGWAMGFMAMLGILSLIGIVINNSIVLIDFIERRVAEGRPLRAAALAAGRVRMRPIVLTTLTTVGGLLPLSLTGGPLWAPMTNGMIFGLLTSTVMTLVVVPTLYVLFAERFGMPSGPRRPAITDA